MQLSIKSPSQWNSSDTDRMATPPARPNQRTQALTRKTSKQPVAITIMLLLLLVTSHAATNLTTLFSFNNLINGYDPRPSLVPWSTNFLYGAASSGGSSGMGTVFKTDLQGNLTVLVVFNGTNGARPYGGVTLASDGNFYGTTMDAGISNNGTIFRMTPQGDLTVLVSFTGTNGQWPSSALIQGADGCLYGATDSGGSYDGGTVFKMRLDGALSTIVSFDRTNGFEPMGELVQASDGNLYGITRLGGDISGGTAFQLTLNGELKTLVSFNYTNGYWPVGGLMQASDGNLYGTTCGMLSGLGGTVFRLTTNGVLTTLASFNGTNGASPLAKLMQANDGNIYGTTTSGGPIGRYGPGTIFRLTPDGSFATLYAFTGGDDGANPRSTLQQMPDGNLYGVTSEGGPYHSGIIFKLSLPMAPLLRRPILANGTASLNWSTVAGQTYQLEYCSDLMSSAWAPLGPPVLANSGEMSATDSFAPDQPRFYRVSLLP